MELETTEVLDSQHSPSESDDGGGAAAAPREAAPPAPSEKGALEKLKEKAAQGVAPPAKSAAEEASEAAAKAAAAFKANLKFRAAGREMDVPQMFHGLIKDAESEKYIHSLLSKAHGIELIQGKLREAREARDTADKAYHAVMEPIAVGREAYARGDLDTVFNVMRIDPNKVLQWAFKKVELSQMPADQRQIHEARIEAERRNWELERSTRFAMQQSQEAQSEQINQMLDLVLERPDVSAIAQAYDSKPGKKEGAFRELVVMMGDQEFSTTGKVISPLEAAKRAVDLLGEKFGAQQATTTAPAAPAPAAPAPAPAKITLPNAGGARATSPGKTKPKSIDDLRKLHQKMATQ